MLNAPPSIATHEYRASGTIPALGETEKPAVSRLDRMRQGLASVRTDSPPAPHNRTILFSSSRRSNMHTIGAGPREIPVRP